MQRLAKTNDKNRRFGVIMTHYKGGFKLWIPL